MVKRKKYRLKLKDKRELVLGEKTLIMGILNVTPDSFSDGRKFFSKDKAVEKALSMIDEGADIIDVGGESTRPGSERVPLKEELKRVIPIIEELRNLTDTLISVDTYKADVAKEAILAGADIVNDISSMRFDEKMHEVVSENSIPIILMHMKGEPKTMQKNPHYNDIFGEIKNFFRERISFSEKFGIKRDKIIIDPGIGFGKTFEDNYRLISNLELFSDLDLPILIGASRKSFLSFVDKREPDKRIEGTAVSSVFSILGGAHILRVHDVGFIKKVCEFTEIFIKYIDEVEEEVQNEQSSNPS